MSRVGLALVRFRQTVRHPQAPPGTVPRLGLLIKSSVVASDIFGFYDTRMGTVLR